LDHLLFDVFVTSEDEELIRITEEELWKLYFTTQKYQKIVGRFLEFLDRKALPVLSLLLNYCRDCEQDVKVEELGFARHGSPIVLKGSVTVQFRMLDHTFSVSLPESIHLRVFLLGIGPYLPKHSS
jgi:hypothetical protein